MPPPIEFPIAKRPPTDHDLRRYLKQALDSDFVFADALMERTEQRHGGSDEQTVDRLSMDDVKALLRGDDPLYSILPETVYEFTTGGDTSLYTAIMGVSFDRGGLIVMGSFCSQAYTLHDIHGNNFLARYCHDLDLGMDAQVLLRPSSENGMWAWFFHDGRSLRERDLSRTGLTIDDFPHIHDRDMIPAMLDDPSAIGRYYPAMGVSGRDDVIAALSRDTNAFRVLREHYWNDTEPAVHAVRSNPLALGFLSTELRNSDAFVHELAGNVPELELSTLLKNKPALITAVEQDLPAHDTADDLPF